MLSKKSVVLDVDGFSYKKNVSVVQELTMAINSAIFLGAVFYAKGKEKTEFLAKYLERKFEKIENSGCPHVENIFFRKDLSCN